MSTYILSPCADERLCNGNTETDKYAVANSSTPPRPIDGTGIHTELRTQVLQVRLLYRVPGGVVITVSTCRLQRHRFGSIPNVSTMSVCSTTASIPVFQTGDECSIHSTRTIQRPFVMLLNSVARVALLHGEGRLFESDRGNQPRSVNWINHLPSKQSYCRFESYTRYHNKEEPCVHNSTVE